MSRDSKVGVSKFPHLGLPLLWAPITLRVDLWLQWGLKQSCSPCRELSNGMSHATCTLKHQVDSQLLVVRSQIVNLTPNLSFGHNLCFKCSNGSCEPILYIYVSIAFQWYITLWRFKNPFGTPTPNNGSSLGSVKVHSLTLSHSQELEMWLLLPSWPITLQVLALVVSPRLGLRHNV